MYYFKIKFGIIYKEELPQQEDFGGEIHNESWVYWQLPESPHSSLIFSSHILQCTLLCL